MRTVSIVFIAALLQAMGSANAQTYSTFVVPDALLTQPVGINASGVVTGYYWDSGSKSHGFVRGVDGTITLFDPKGATTTAPVAIDKDGTVVGSYDTADFFNHGFIRKPNGKIVSFDPPKSLDTFVSGIAGNTIGTEEPGGTEKGFIRSRDGNYSIFRYPGKRDTEPQSINDAGAIVGSYRSKDGFATHGFLRHPDGTFEEIVAHGSTVPVAINASGVIVGEDAHEGVFVRAADGTVTTIKIAGANDTEAVGINVTGVVVGYSHNDDGTEHGFMWTPEQGVAMVDVPSALSTVLADISDDGTITGKCFFPNGNGTSEAAFIRIP